MTLRIWGCEDARIQASTPQPEDMRMQGYKQGIWAWRYVDVRMWGYKQVHTNIRILGSQYARIQANAQEPKDMKMWGYKPVKYIKPVGYY